MDIDLKTIHSVNQILKKFNGIYYYIDVDNIFLSRAGGYDVLHINHGFNYVKPLSISEPDSLFKVLDKAKSLHTVVDVDYIILENDRQEEYTGITVLSAVERRRTIRSFNKLLSNKSALEKVDNEILNEYCSLYYNNELISETLDMNQITDLVKGRVSNDSDHTILFAVIEKGKALYVTNEASKLDTSKLFIILPKELLLKSKLLKKDSIIFKMYYKDNTLLIHTGVSNKQETYFSMNILTEV